MEPKTVVVEKTYPVPVHKVWQALTDKEKIKQWSFDMDDFKPEVGFEFHFYGHNDGRTFCHICVVTEAIENKKLAYTWSYQDTPGKSLVSIELFDESDKTRLKLTHSGLETFPQDSNDYSINNFTMGWTQLITVLLDKFLQG
jgi:uncharacterized protein YndB with AHSA1/START domain